MGKTSSKEHSDSLFVYGFAINLPLFSLLSSKNELYIFAVFLTFIKTKLFLSPSKIVFKFVLSFNCRRGTSLRVFKIKMMSISLRINYSNTFDVTFLTNVISELWPVLFKPFPFKFCVSRPTEKKHTHTYELISIIRKWGKSVFVSMQPFTVNYMMIHFSYLLLFLHIKLQKASSSAVALGTRMYENEKLMFLLLVK